MPNPKYIISKNATGYSKNNLCSSFTIKPYKQNIVQKNDVANFEFKKLKSMVGTKPHSITVTGKSQEGIFCLITCTHLSDIPNSDFGGRNLFAVCQDNYILIDEKMPLYFNFICLEDKILINNLYLR